MIGGSAESRAGKYLSFRLAKEEFAIPLGSVREVMSLQAVAPVGDAPEYVKGVMNRGGKVIPVLDLRLKFGLPGAAPGRKTCILVVQVKAAGGEFLAGLVVDSVLDVVDIRRGAIRKPPDVGAAYLIGTARLNQRLKILLDTDHVLSYGEVQGLRSMLPV